MATDELIATYLADLEAALADLPRARRSEIVEEVSEHIAEARSAAGDQTEAGIRNVLERLGPPAEIAKEARARFGIELVKPGPRERWGIAVLAIGGLVLPLVGWLIGVAMLWGSKVWSRREKVLGTLLVPGGLSLPFYLLVFAPLRSCTVVDGVEQGCTGGGSVLYGVVFGLALVLAIVGPICLAVRLRKRSRAASV